MALMKKLTSAVVASSLVLGLAGVAAATTPDKVQAAATRMQKLNLVKGVDASGTDLALNANLTRAQLVTILVRAFGQDANAKYLDGAAAFTDTANHPWASGYIAMAKRIIAERTNGKEVVGLPDGSFNPDGNVTAAEAVAFLMKFVGAPADSTKAWPDNYISGALNAGIITAEDKTVLDGIKNTPATRGLAFYLADRAFYGYKLAEGGTVYTTFVDPSAPTVTVDNADNSNTLEEKVTVTGTVSADVVSVTVGSLDNAATITDGKFTASVNLAIGENSILVHAVDRAGNASEKTVKVTRTVGAAASIEASDITVAAGGTAAVTATVKDAKGNAITGATVTGESTVGTFDGTSFKAGEKAGEGTLTLKVGEVTKSVKVTVTAGALAAVTASNATPAVGERVTLSAQDQYGNAVTGASFTVDSADALVDSTQGILIASKAGNYNVTATKDGKTATLKVGVYSSTVKKLIVSAPEQAVGNTDTGVYNGTDYVVTIKAVDANGNLVANYDGDITLTTDAAPAVSLGTDETSSTKAAKNGVATWNVRLDQALVGRQVEFGGVTTLNAGTADETVIGDSSTEVTTAKTEVIEQVATSVKFDTTGTQTTIRANEGTAHASSVMVYLADQNGKRFLGKAGYVVNLAVTGAAELDTDADSFVYEGVKHQVFLNSIQGETGDITLTATVDGIGSVTTSLKAAIAGDAAAVTLKSDVAQATANNNADDGTVTFTAQVVDKNGVPVAADATELTVTLNSDATVTDADGNDVSVFTSDAGTVTPGTDKSTFKATTGPDGKVEFTLEAGQFVGDLNVTVQDSAKKYTAASTSVKFVADKASAVKLTRTSLIKVASSDPKATLSAQVYDASGNKAPVAGVKVKFSAGTDDVKFNGTAKELEVTTDANGVASVDASLLNYVGATYTVTITAETADGKALDTSASNTVSLYVSNNLVTTLSTTVTDSVTGLPALQVKAGTPVTFSTKAKDANGKVILGENLVLIPNAKVLDANGDAIDTTNGIKMDVEVDEANAPTGNYVVTVTPAASGTISFTVKDKTPSAAVTGTASLRVTPTTASKLVVNGGDALSLKQKTASGAITLKLADTYGNAVTAATKDAVTFKVYTATQNQDGDWVSTGTEYTEMSFGIRTSASGADVTGLNINAGNSSAVFYIFNNVPYVADGDNHYVVEFTDASGYTGSVVVSITK